MLSIFLKIVQCAVYISACYSKRYVNTVFDWQQAYIENSTEHFHKNGQQTKMTWINKDCYVIDNQKY